MAKLVILMVIAIVLLSLFGANFSVLLGGFVSGGNMIASALFIFLDFYSRTLGALIKQAYIQNLLFMFLFVWVFAAIVKFIRGGIVPDDYEEQDIIATSVDGKTKSLTVRIPSKRDKHGKRVTLVDVTTFNKGNKNEK